MVSQRRVDAKPDRTAAKEKRKKAKEAKKTRERPGKNKHRRGTNGRQMKSLVGRNPVEQINQKKEKLEGEKRTNLGRRKNRKGRK